MIDASWNYKMPVGLFGGVYCLVSGKIRDDSVNQIWHCVWNSEFKEFRICEANTIARRLETVECWVPLSDLYHGRNNPDDAR